MRPRTKNIEIKNHHFRSFIPKEDRNTLKAETAEQEAEFLTEPLSAQLLSYLRKKVIGW